MTEKELAERIYNDPVFYIENFLWIKTKEGEIQKLKLKKVQRIVVDYVVTCLKNNLPIRAIILKARQEGMSTIIEALGFWWTNTHKNASFRILAHDTDGSNNLFNMSKTYYDKLHPAIKPMKKYSNRKELVFDNPNDLLRGENPGLNSRIQVSTAGSKETGRSETNQLVHASEIAFWDYPAEIMAGMMQTVPMKPKTMVFLESTANGIGGYFYEEYQRAKRGESTFKAFFFPWFMEAEYVMPADPDFETTDDEKKLIRETKKEFDISLTNDQLYWRRNKRAELESANGKFQQEYPSNDYEAFIASGRPRFDVESLKWYLEEIVTTPQTGQIINRKFVQDDRGTLSVWRQPHVRGSYVIGVDVSEGLIKGDNSVIQVLDRHTAEQVAELVVKCDPDELGRKVYALGRFYNDALVGVEANNHGLTTLTILKQMNYPHIYYRKILGDRKNATTTKLGWHTSVKSKPLMIDELATWIRDRDIKFNSKALVDECLTYVIDENGATNAQEGCLDDRVTSFAIALQMYKLVSTYEEPDPIYKR
jgi:hypothetical protein